MTSYFTFRWNILDENVKDCSNCNVGSNRIDYVSLKSVDLVIDECMRSCDEKNKTPYFSVTSNALRFHSNFWKLLELFYEHNLKFNISGNDLQLNSQICEKLNEMECSYYRMNLDGLRKTHDDIHGWGSYDIVLDNVNCLHYADVKTDIFTSISLKNISQVPWIIDEVVRNKVDNYHFSYYCKSCGIDLFEYKILLEKVWEKYIQYKDFNTSFSIKENILSLFLYENYMFENSKEICGCMDSKSFPMVDVQICDGSVRDNIDEKIVSIL